MMRLPLTCLRIIPAAGPDRHSYPDRGSSNSNSNPDGDCHPDIDHYCNADRHRHANPNRDGHGDPDSSVRTPHGQSGTSQLRESAVGHHE